MPGLAQAADCLNPAERLFDPLSLDHADSIAGMASRARINRRTAVGPALSSIMSSAVVRSAVPLASVQPGIDDEPVAVLHHQVTHMSELGLLAGTFAKQRVSGSVVEECVAFARFSP